MYTAYQKDIKKYIVHRTYDQIESYSDVPRLQKGQCYRYIESVPLDWIIACIKHMFHLLGVNYVKIGYKLLIGENRLVFGIKTVMEPEWYLNEYSLVVLNNRGSKCCGLLLFLLDPLRFVEMNWKMIIALEDETVRGFLLELKCTVENMRDIHIKFFYIMNMPLVDDIKKLIIDQYIALVIDRDVIIKLLGDNNNSLVI